MEYRNVREQVTDQIRAELLLGKFKAGEAMREIPLAERFNVSRGPIRDALLQLSQEACWNLRQTAALVSARSGMGN